MNTSCSLHHALENVLLRIVEELFHSNRLSIHEDIVHLRRVKHKTLHGAIVGIHKPIGKLILFEKEAQVVARGTLRVKIGCDQGEGKRLGTAVIANLLASSASVVAKVGSPFVHSVVRANYP